MLVHCPRIGDGEIAVPRQGQAIGGDCVETDGELTGAGRPHYSQPSIGEVQQAARQPTGTIEKGLGPVHSHNRTRPVVGRDAVELCTIADINRPL